MIHIIKPLMGVILNIVTSS